MSKQFFPPGATSALANLDDNISISAGDAGTRHDGAVNSTSISTGDGGTATSS